MNKFTKWFIIWKPLIFWRLVINKLAHLVDFTFKRWQKHVSPSCYVCVDVICPHVIVDDLTQKCVEMETLLQWAIIIWSYHLLLIIIIIGVVVVIFKTKQNVIPLKDFLLINANRMKKKETIKKRIWCQLWQKFVKNTVLMLLGAPMMRQEEDNVCHI